MSLETNQFSDYPNASPEFASDSLKAQVAASMERLENLKNDEITASDPAIVPLAEQVNNHLKHTTYDFRIAGDSEDYPYDLRGRGAYPAAPTERALAKADRLFELMGEDEISAPQLELTANYGEEAREAQQQIVKNLLTDPLAAYQDFSDRKAQYGPEAPFPELGWTLKGMLYETITKPEVEQACAVSPVLNKLRLLLITDMQAKIEENTFGYKSTLLMIEDAVAFFDVVVRTNHPDSPKLFHSGLFEYNWHSFVEDSKHTVFPTMASVNSTDLLKLRGVPIGLIGVFTDTMTVDGYRQTPYEFFHHDVDHTRRMHEETLLGIEREGITPQQYAEDATKLIFETLLPAVDLEGITDEDERDHRIAMRMILFEILHEDAYDPVRDTVADAILRDPKERMPFERQAGSTVEYFMTQRATVLAHVYRKLSGNFYDFPEKRSTSLGTDFVRTRLAIADAAKDLYRLMSDDPITDEALLTTCRDLVSTDENFSQSFLAGLSDDIASRGKGRNALRLGISRPLGVTAAVRKARRLKESLAGDAGQIHSLFGYSGLGYEDPELLESVVAYDLSKNFDPSNTIIAIGATPYGIGRVYPIAKELGFMTLGVVASTALGRNEDAADGVDEFIIVKDQGWGGFKYAQDSHGLLSPTTRVFVGASDSIAAYGGGGITAVTLEEMRRRHKPISFRPFDMNHHDADVQHAQTGATDKLDYHGPANAKWQELTAKQHRS